MNNREIGGKSNGKQRQKECEEAQETKGKEGKEVGKDTGKL